MTKIVSVSRATAARLLAGTAVSVALVAVLAAAAFANTLSADCTKPSTDLQALIDAANDGDTILVRGICVGQFVVTDKAITLQGVGKKAALDGNGQGIVLSLGKIGAVCADMTVNDLIVRNGDTGIATSACKLTLTNITVTGNQDFGISGFFPGATTISSSIIQGNGVGFGAEFCVGPPPVGAIITIDNTRVRSNAGVGVMVRECELAINRSTITNNQAGGISNDTALMTLTNSNVANNVRSGDGAGIVNKGSLNLVNSAVVRNHATNSFYGGGGIFNDPDSSMLSITGSLISRNSTDGSGGGIYLYGGPFTLDHSLIAHNRAALDGGGLFINSFDSADATFTGSDSITRNRAGQDGGGVCNESSAVIVPADIATHDSPDEFCKP
jgi:hypothetical protein